MKRGTVKSILETNLFSGQFQERYFLFNLESVLDRSRIKFKVRTNCSISHSLKLQEVCGKYAQDTQEKAVKLQAGKRSGEQFHTDKLNANLSESGCAHI
jgi:hypothetical protein